MNNDLIIRKVSPPILKDVNIGKKILCNRPVRIDGPRIDLSIINGKIIANNYGHGGNGWTLAPGSASYIVHLLNHSLFSLNLSKNDNITIIGAGVIGLFTAFELLSKDYRNITIVAEHFENLVSHKAGGMIAPVYTNNSVNNKLSEIMGIKAYRFYRDIANKKNIYFDQGATILPAYFPDKKSSGLEGYIGKVMSPAKSVILDFMNGTKREMVAYDDAIFVDTTKIMELLHNSLRNKVNFIQKFVDHLDEIDSNIIINCTAMGSKALIKDDKMISIQGHLINLKYQNPLNHVIINFVEDAKTMSNLNVKRFIYNFPKYNTDNQIGIIGGTFIENADDDTANLEEFDLIIERAKVFYGLNN